MMIASYTDDDTICAISTPAGMGGIAVIRISGRDAMPIVARCWKGATIEQMKSHTAHLGRIIDPADGSVLDEVVLTDIYPAREEPIPGVSSKLIYDNIKAGVEKTMIKKDDVLDYVRNRDFDVLEILGAGNLDDLVPQIAEIIKAKEK